MNLGEAATSSKPAHRATGTVLVLGERGGLGVALLRRLEQEGAPATSALG